MSQGGQQAHSMPRPRPGIYYNNNNNKQTTIKSITSRCARPISPHTVQFTSADLVAHLTMRLLPLLLPLAGLATARFLDSWTVRAVTHGNGAVTDASGISGVQLAVEAGGVDDGMRKVVDNVRRWVVKGAGEGARVMEGVRRKGQGVNKETILEKAAARRDQKEWQILELTRCM